MSTKELGTIKDAQVDVEHHNIITVWITIDFDGGGTQRFGGLAFQKLDYSSVLSKKDDTLINDYIKSVCAAFEVPDLKDLIGKKCFALKSFDSWNQPIEGLESECGKRFTIFSWQKKHFPDALNALETKIEMLKREVTYFEHRKQQSIEELKTIKDKFVDWG